MLKRAAIERTTSNIRANFFLLKTDFDKNHSRVLDFSLNILVCFDVRTAANQD